MQFGKNTPNILTRKLFIALVIELIPEPGRYPETLEDS